MIEPRARTFWSESNLLAEVANYTMQTNYIAVLLS